MIPETETVFYAPSLNARVVFMREASGRVTSFTSTGDGDVEAKKLE